MFSMFFRWVAIVVCLVAVEMQTVAGEYDRQRDGAGCEPGWSPLGDLTGELSSQVYALAVFDDGNGEALIAATIAGIQRWDGEAWTLLGTPSSIVNALIVHDDGSGEALYAAGNFTSISGIPANRVAKWNGTEWSALGEGLDAQAAALAVFDDGSGSALYVGGQFSSAGGVTARRIARWDGSAWTGVDNGISDDYLNVLSLGVYDDGSGATLYAGVGPGVPNTASASRILRLSSDEWVEIGMIPYTMLNTGFPFVLHAHDDGSGEALYLGGVFAGVDGVPGTTGFARWDGVGWSAVGGNFLGQVFAAASLSTDSGSVLYVGGDSFTVDGQNFDGVAQWDGVQWSELSGGVQNGSVRAMASSSSVIDGTPALYVGGTFQMVNGEPSPYLAKWVGCDLEVSCPGDVTGNGAVNLDDFAVLAANFGSGPGASREQGDLNGDGFVDLADFNILAVHFGSQCR